MDIVVLRNVVETNMDAVITILFFRALGFSSMPNNFNQLIYTGTIDHLKRWLRVIDQSLELAVPLVAQLFGSITENDNVRADVRLDVSDVENVCIKTLLTKLDKRILYSLQPIIDQFEQMGRLSKLTYDLCILYCFWDVKLFLSGVDYGNDVFNTVVKNVSQNSGFGQRLLLSEFNQYKRGSPELEMDFVERMTWVAREIIMFSNNINKCNDKSFDKTMIYVNYICKDLQIIDKNKHKYPDPNKIVEKYWKQGMIIKEKRIGAFLPFRLHRDAIDKNTLKKDAQRLRENLQRWQCYYCTSINNSKNNECQSCNKGLNPLYFSIKNKSEYFVVDPQKFGIIKLLSNVYFVKKLNLLIVLICFCYSYLRTVYYALPILILYYTYI